MQRINRKLASLLGLALLVCTTTAYATQNAQPPAIGWVANAGQWSDEVQFRVDTRSGPTFLLESDNFLHQLNGTSQPVRERLLGANPKAVTRGQKPQTTKVNFFYGNNPKNWQTNLSTYQQVLAEDIYPGIDMLLTLRDQEIEKIFTLQPGADARQIRFRLDGVATPEHDPAGNLVVMLADGKTQLQITAPKAWQENGDTTEHINVDWALADDGSFGFAVASYDAQRPLIIDPIIRTTYFGGSQAETGSPFIHANGDIYLVGSTESTDLPNTTGGAQATSTSNPPVSPIDIFAARLSPDLTTIRQVTYLGGTSNETNPEQVVASNGDIIIAGNTESADFPGTTGGAQAAYNGAFLGGDIFLARLSADLTTLVQATYLGGTGDETFSEILADTSDSVYVLGATGSSDFPGTAGGAQATRGDASPVGGELFVAKLSASLTTLQQSTYYGGNSLEFGLSIILSDNGVYVSGATASTDLPGTAGGAQAAIDPISGTPLDAFVVLFNNALTSITQATYYGGSEAESSGQLQEIDNNLYLTGFTQSPDLPNTAGGAQPAYAGGSPAEEVFDGFIALLNPALTSVTQATYFGGTGTEAVFLARFGTGNLYISGLTTSTDLPGTTGGAQPDFGGGSELGDAFVAILTPNLQTLVQSTYLGGSGDDAGFALFAPNGDLYVSGSTTSSDFPGVTGGLQEAYGGTGGNDLGDLFVARLSSDLTTLIQATYFGGNGDDSGGIAFDTNGNAYLAGDTTSTNLVDTTGAAQTSHANSATDDLFISLVSADLTGSGGPPPDPDPSGPVFGAALPGQRVFSIGGPGVTFFGTIINTASTTAVDCSIQLDGSLPVTFSYQTTNAMNQLIGSPDTPADIPGGGAQSYLFSITPTQAFASTEVQPIYDCTNTDPAPVFSGVNTVNVLSTSTPTPDVVAIVLSPTNDGIAHLPGATGSVAVAMATVNVGASGDVTLATDTGSVDLGVIINVCQTNPSTGACLAPPSPDVTLTIGNNQTPTFSVFITGSQVIALDPAVNRLNLRFLVDGDTQVGQSSLALATDEES